MTEEEIQDAFAAWEAVPNLVDASREDVWRAINTIPALVAALREERAERERLAGLLSGIDWRALPDNYKHNLQRAEETVAEALALLGERGDMHRELELENEKLQAENSTLRAENERLRAREADLVECIDSIVGIYISDCEGGSRYMRNTLSILNAYGLYLDNEGLDVKRMPS